jgi:hypothetical protein
MGHFIQGTFHPGDESSKEHNIQGMPDLKKNFRGHIGQGHVVIAHYVSAQPVLMFVSIASAELSGSNDLIYTVKKVHEFPVSSRDVINQTPPGQE